MAKVREDPVAKYKFMVEVKDVVTAWFLECSGLSVEREAIPQKEGGVNDYVHQMPGRISYSRITLKWFLDTFGYVVQTARSAHEALTVFDSSLHDLVLTDNSMPGMTGAEMAHIIKMRSPHTPVLMYTGEPPADRSCLDIIIQKPAPLMELKNALDQLFGDTTNPRPPIPE